MMKVPLPSWTYCKRALITFTAIVAVCVIIFVTIQGGARSRFMKTLYETSRIQRICNQLSKKDSINWNYFYYYEDIQTKKSLVWCKVPKAGSTTLTKMFLRLANNSAGKKDLKDINNSTRIHKLLRNHYPRLPAKVMKNRIQDSKTFLVVRDPFERILSAFRDKLENYERDLEYRDGYYYDNYGRFMVKGENGNITRKEPTWPEFVQYLLKTSVARYDEHWMPITKLCSPCSVDYNIVIKMEHFANEIKKPLNYANIKIANLGWAHKTGTSSSKNVINSYYKKLTLTDVRKLYRKYKSDFQLFGYTPYKYFQLFGDKVNKTK